MAYGRQYYLDPANHIAVDCEASPKAVALLRFFADSMEEALAEKKREKDAAMCAAPWSDLIAEAWAAPFAVEAKEESR